MLNQGNAYVSSVLYLEVGKIKTFSSVSLKLCMPGNKKIVTLHVNTIAVAFTAQLSSLETSS